MKPEEAILTLHEIKTDAVYCVTSEEKDALNMAIEALKERPHGEWLSHYEYCKKHDCIPSGLIAFWWCNKCEQGVEIPTNFCPNCGADMTKKEGNEDV